MTPEPTAPIPTRCARLHKILAEARAADKFPWGPGRVSLYRTIFPQMTNWLPEEESASCAFSSTPRWSAWKKPSDRHAGFRTMAGPRQGNLFSDDELSDLYGSEPAPAYRPDLDDVRARLQKVLAKVRAANKLPPDTVSIYRAIIPRMTTWLPQDEGAKLRFEFEAELERLKAA